MQRFGLLLVCLLGVAFFARPALTQRPVTLSFLIQAQEASKWPAIIQQFEAENPGIRLNLVEGPNPTNQVEDLYTAAFLLGKAPYDLVYMDITWVPKFAAAGWLLDLSDRIAREELAQFLAADVEGGRYEGGLYRLPFRTDFALLYYRKDLLEEAGLKPPKTFDELMQISQNLKAQAKAEWGFVWPGRQYEGAAAMFVEILKGHGGFWIDPGTGEVGLDQPPAIDAVRFLRSTIEQGVSPPGVTNYAEDQVRFLFQSGGAVFMRNWPYAFPLANAPDSPVRGKVAIQPMVSAPGGESGACKGGWGLGIAKTTRHPQEALRAIQFISSLNTQRDFMLETGYVPSRPTLYADSQIVAKYDYYPQLLAVAEQAVLRPPIPQYAQASDILQRYLSAAFSGQLSPEQAMQRAARETRALLGRYQGGAG